MKNIINTSELQRKGLKEVYETIDKYGQAFIINQRSNKVLEIIDKESPRTLINIIKSLKSIKEKLSKEYGVNNIGIFGSYARGENTQDSDLDILIDKDLSLEQLLEVEKIISQATRIETVDLSTNTSIRALALLTAKKDLIYV